MRKYNELTLGQIEAMVNKLGGMDGVDRLLRGELVISKPDSISSTSYSLTVNYNLSIEEAVKLGHYNWVNSDITSQNFEAGRKGEKKVTVELLHLDRFVSTDEALREMDSQGYRPAELHELLALGENHPDLQREFPIVALGSVWQYRDGNRFVPYLGRNGARRSLSLDWVQSVWGEVYRFALVRK